MQSIEDIIQNVARARTRPDGNPILFWRSLGSAEGRSVNHLSVSNELGQAWVAMTGELFRPHQAHALAMLRRGESIALRSESTTLYQSLFLLIAALFEAEHTAMGLVVTDDAELAETVADIFDQLNQGIPVSAALSIDVITPQTRFHPQRRLLICPAELLHTRLLGHHSRAWAPFWSRLRLIAIPEIQRFRGVAGTHLAELLRRSQRIAAAYTNQELPILASLPPMLNAEPALLSIANQPVRVVNADDTGQQAGLVVVWRSGSSLMRDIAELASELDRNKISVHVLCSMMEQAALQPALGDLANVTSGPQPRHGTVLICVGIPESLSNLRRLVRSDHETVIVVLGELLQEQQFARQSDMILTAPATAWAISPPNAYVLAQHLLCAASERDLQASEVEQWGLQKIVDRLIERQSLVELPDPELAWKPGPNADDPYLNMSLLSASGVAVDVYTETGRLIAALDPTAFERWAFPGAALPPLRGGLGVIGHNDENVSIIVRTESGGRRTFPIRRCQVNPREQSQSRTLVGGMTLTLGRVMIEELVEGYREHIPGNQAKQKMLEKPLSSTWAAPACSMKLNTIISATNQLVGWSINAAVALYAAADMIDLVPCYDEQSAMLYFIDAQPGGSGLAAWLYENAEQLFQLAFDIAYAGRHDALLEPICRNDRDWLQLVLGKAGHTSESGTVFVPAPDTPEEPPFIELGPPTTPRPDPKPVSQEKVKPVEKPAPPPSAPSQPAPKTVSQEKVKPVEKPAPPPSTPSQPAPPRPGLGQSAPRTEAVKPTPLQPQAPAQKSENPAPDRQERPPVIPPVARAQPLEKPVPEQAPPSIKAETNPKQPSPELSEKPAVQKPAADQHSPPAASKAKAEEPESKRVNKADPPQQEPEEEATDAAALIARLRRQREQRESQQQKSRPHDSSSKPARHSGPVLQRFKTGDHVFCLPYGDGVVYESRIEQGHEILIVTFPDYGDLEINPELNLVRHMKSEAGEQDDLL